MSARRPSRLTDFAAGLAAVVIVLAAAWLVFGRINPFSDRYELTAVLRDVENLQVGSPVRVAGVDVGEVTAVEPGPGGTARVTFELDDAGRPVHEDARLEVQPRLFLEGNYVIDLKPGSPSAPELEDGGTIPVEQTAGAVNFDEITRVLDRDTRRSLRTLLRDYSAAYEEGGAEAFRDSIPQWREAYRTTALAADAWLGTEEGDLRRAIEGQQGMLAALGEDADALGELVSGLNETTAALAGEAEALAASVPALRDALETGMPALASVNAAIPSLRAFAREALPGVRSAGPAVRAARPFAGELSRLVGEDELKGLAADLRDTAPALARLGSSSVGFFSELRALSSCTANVLVPFAEAPIPDPDFPEADGQPFYKEISRTLVGLAGESRVGDANGQWFRLNGASSGVNLLQLDGPLTETLFGSPLFQPLGVRPIPPEKRTRFRPDVPCETQEPPNLEAQGGGAGGQQTTLRARDGEPQRRVATELRRLREFLAGERKRNPLDNRGLRELMPKQEGRR